MVGRAATAEANALTTVRREVNLVMLSQKGLTAVRLESRYRCRQADTIVLIEAAMIYTVGELVQNRALISRYCFAPWKCSNNDDA